MVYLFLSFLSVLLFALVHVSSRVTAQLNTILHGKLLSTGGGIAIAYVFIDLLPKLGKSDQTIQHTLKSIFPYIEKHAYVMALTGFLLFFVVSQSRNFLQGKGRFWLSLLSYSFFNFLIGYAVVDQNNLEVQPLLLFTIAMALHFFVNDFSLSKEHGEAYHRIIKWVLILFLFLGWLTGLWIKLPEAAVALVSAFIGGGVIMNVTRHELPKHNPHNLGAFLIASILYTLILLTIGKS